MQDHLNIEVCVQFFYLGQPWLVQLVTSLPSDNKVPCSIPGFAEIWIDLSNSIDLLGANLQWISVPSRGSQRLPSA